MKILFIAENVVMALCIAMIVFIDVISGVSYG